MSKIGKKPILIPAGVEVTSGMESGRRTINFKGKLGVFGLPILPYIVVKIQDGAITVSSTHTMKQGRANWGTMASLVKSALQGVMTGFTKNLEFEGVGFRAAVSETDLKLNVGFSHEVKYSPPKGITLKVEKNVISVSGIDKALVGRVAAEIRKIKKPEPYKGTGIRYQGEVIRRKAGKKAVTTAA